MSDEALVSGLRIGHATNAGAATGCTVLLGPFHAAVHVSGMATASRELETLTPTHLAPLAHAIVLAGGSAFGLAAADGVTAWLEERGVGFDTGTARVPIVPAACIYDLGVGRADVRPDAAMGRAACEAAGDGVPESGRVGAGTGATVGKVLGPAGAMRGGFGAASAAFPGFAMTAVAVVNALGDVLAADGRILAGARLANGEFAGSAAWLRARGSNVVAYGPEPGTNTTLAAIVTDAAVDRASLGALARMAATGVARRIEPVHSPFDGDIVFAASTAATPAAPPPAALLALGSAAAHLVGIAIERAVTV